MSGKSQYMHNAHIEPATSVCELFQVDPDVGLSSNQIYQARQIYGWNELEHAPTKSIWALFVEQFQDLLTRILLLAAFISFVLALITDGETGFTAFVEPIVILAILMANAVVSIWQESTAEKSLEALKRLQPEIAHALRDGKWKSLPAKELVPGDICLVSTGDKIPADLRIIRLKTISMRAEQSQLTGESRTVPKEAVTLDADLADCEIQAKVNILFASTTIAHGSAVAVVLFTGMKTEIGKIQSAVQEAGLADVETPLQRKLDQFGELLSKVIGAICLLVWLINIRNFSDPSHGGFLQGSIYYFKTAVALAVAAIPEGLTAVITTCLALGTRKLAKKNAIVRHLPSVETLGCTTIICSDKTGTLTTNKMRCVEFLVPSISTKLERYRVTAADSDLRAIITEQSTSTKLNQLPLSHNSLVSFIQCASLCNAANLTIHKSKLVEVQGEPTEIALQVLVEQLKIPNLSADQTMNAHWRTLYKEVAVLEFTRSRKCMSVVYKKNNSNSYIQFVKGAPETILDLCAKVQLSDGSSPAITDSFKADIRTHLHEMASVHAQRVLAFAYTTQIHPELLNAVSQQNVPHFQTLVAEDPDKFAQFETDLVFCGLAGLMDPPRPEVAKAVASCQEAGIKVIMITGDNKDTAEAIASRIGITDPADMQKASLLGRDFEKLSDSERLNFFSRMKKGAIFSRTEPKHKQMIVACLKRNGEVVAMTGDGVNDAPALKQADIGIAMGISGTEVAKEASDMILADDNFQSIVEAVQEGRSIFNNMRAFIRYLISSNIGEVASIFLTAALGIPEGFLPVQLLWVNLVTDGLPATALGFNPPDKNVMKKKPRNHDDPLINSSGLIRYFIIGLYVGLATVGIFISWFTLRHDFEDNHSLVSYNMLSHWTQCHKWSDFQVNPVYSMIPNDPCSYFVQGKIKASTLSLTVLVVIEMFNALNALSDETSLLVMPPWSNPLLILAILGSIGLHMIILYVDFFAKIFGVVPLNFMDWIHVILWSAPVLVIDEMMKAYSRLRTRSKDLDLKYKAL